MFNTFEEAVTYWNDSPESHTKIFRTFFDNVQNDPQLKHHRDTVEAFQLGYGDRPYHWMWNLIIEQMPENFKFLEIGVYMGQVISLVSLLNTRYDKKGEVFALTPLEPADDDYSKHHAVDYEAKIQEQFARNDLKGEDIRIIKGYSQDPKVVSVADRFQPYDCIYIDGNHNYEMVVQDIENFTPMVKVGGLLVVDDACLDMQIPDGVIRMNWKGMESVQKAVDDKLTPDDRFEVVLTCGHNRVLRRTK